MLTLPRCVDPRLHLWLRGSELGTTAALTCRHPFSGRTSNLVRLHAVLRPGVGIERVGLLFEGVEVEPGHLIRENHLLAGTSLAAATRCVRMHGRRVEVVGALVPPPTEMSGMASFEPRLVARRLGVRLERTGVD